MSEQLPQRPARIEVNGPSGLSLKELVPEDAQRYFELIEFDRDHLRQFGDETADNYKTVEDVLKSIGPHNPKIRFGIWDGNVMTGSINLKPANGVAEVGYWIGAEHLRKGYASRAVADLSQYAFENLGFNRLIALVVVGNKASQGVLQKAGYELTGMMERMGKKEWVYELNKPATPVK